MKQISTTAVVHVLFKKARVSQNKTLGLFRVGQKSNLWAD